jgi:hypothetical protein
VDDVRPTLNLTQLNPQKTFSSHISSASIEVNLGPNNEPFALGVDSTELVKPITLVEVLPSKNQDKFINILASCKDYF